MYLDMAPTSWITDNSDFENLGKLMAVRFLLGFPGIGVEFFPGNWSVPLSCVPLSSWFFRELECTSIMVHPRLLNALYNQ